MSATSSANSSESRRDASELAVSGFNDRRKAPVGLLDTAAVKLDEEPAVVVGEPNAAMHPTPQDDQLMSERRVLGFKPALRLEW